MNHNQIPALIEWRGPNGSVVRLTEDGIDVQAPRTLEHGEVARLLAIIDAAKDAIRCHSAPVPRPPTIEEMRDMRWVDGVISAKLKAVVRDVEKTFHSEP